MAITFEGTRYLAGPAQTLYCMTNAWRDLGVRTTDGGVEGHLYIVSGRLVFVFQPLNSNYRSFRELMTTAELLEGWS